jgi:hypothetical protein
VDIKSFEDLLKEFPKNLITPEEYRKWIEKHKKLDTIKKKETKETK